MRKLRTLLILLLAMFLIAAGAYLPRIAAAVQDGQTLGHTATEPMQSLVLELGGETQAPGYMMRKLALEQNMMTIPISAGEASMTQEDVFAAAEKGMEGYIEAGMFEWFEYNFRNAEPYLGIDADDKSNFTVFWSVTLDYQGDPYQYLFLHIDDETGKILYINYVTYADDQFKYYYPDNQQLMMEDFVSTYFSQLDLTDLADYAYLNGTGTEKVTTADDVTAVRYSFGDLVYGEVSVDFYITPVGFYTVLARDQQ